jgi:hypothetical protein
MYQWLLETLSLQIFGQVHWGGFDTKYNRMYIRIPLYSIVTREMSVDNKGVYARKNIT